MRIYLDVYGHIFLPGLIAVYKQIQEMKLEHRFMLLDDASVNLPSSGHLWIYIMLNESFFSDYVLS